MARDRPDQVHLVTGARRSRYDDIATRERRYIIRMAIRTAAVLVAFFAPIPLWAKGIAIILGLVLPWVSVTSANIGPLPDEAHFMPTTRELPEGERPDDPDTSGSPPTIDA